MSTFLIFPSLFIFFKLYVVTTTANVTNSNVFNGSNINNTYIFNVSIYCPSFEYVYHLRQSLSMLFEFSSLPIVDDCIEVKYIHNGVAFSESQQCVKVIDDNKNDIRGKMKC